MRVFLVVVAVLCSGVSYAAGLPLFFDSGSNFSGTITRHKFQGDPGLEARFSRVGEKITLRMLTMAGKAVILAAKKVGTDNSFIGTYQINNDDSLFSAGKRALEQKANLFDRASRSGDSFFRADVYQPQEYQNKDLIVAAHLLTEAGGLVVKKSPEVTIVLHPFNNDVVQGEFLVTDPNGVIFETAWFETKREGQQATPPPPPAPAPSFN